MKKQRNHLGLNEAIAFLIMIGLFAVPVAHQMNVPDRCTEKSTSVGCRVPPTYLEPPP